MKSRKKLIEVALPLEAINAASAREKSIRHGHPSTLHLWWARRPLAAARAVIFSQMVDDPSEYTQELLSDEGLAKAAQAQLQKRIEERKAKEELSGDAAIEPEPTLEGVAADVERKRLFTILEELVAWENTTNEAVLEKARAEIRRSWRRTCADNADHPRAKELFDPDKLPGFHDPFAGGGALPLEAQRLGLEAHASDLNPVAVLINKAMIEIPPRFASRHPINPDSQNPKSLTKGRWRGAEGLAEDVRYYGRRMRDKALERIGNLYPSVNITPEMASERPDLQPYEGRDLSIIAWLWARTVPSPDPALGGAPVPLIASYWLSKRKGRLAWVTPIIEEATKSWRFEVRTGTPDETKTIDEGTKTGRGTFRCLLTGAPMNSSYLHEQGRQGRIGERLVAIVAAGTRRRLYLNPSRAQEDTARDAKPAWTPETQLGTNTRHLTPVAYGYTTHANLHTQRQLTILDTLAACIPVVRDQVLHDAYTAGLDEGRTLVDGGNGARAYADSVAIMLGIAISRRHDRWSAFSIWNTVGEKLESLIRLSAVPMTWQFAEANPFSSSTGNFIDGVALTAKAIETLGDGKPGHATQADARDLARDASTVICTDPPYFDNVPYADLSDLFYVWLRRTLHPLLPDLMSTMLVPKADELVADPSRHGGREAAERFFLARMREVIAGLHGRAIPSIPVSIFYAFKQSESKEDGIVSTGWDTFLSALIESGFSIVGTWPVRTEQSGGLRNVGRNSLATSVVLVCRQRATSAPTTSRRDFVSALRAELPTALAALQSSNIAPVDLAQAAIGPGMAIYTRYARVLESNGSPLSVRTGLALINQVLDETLAEQEGDFDADTRWALSWFAQSGFDRGDYGVAETLSKAKNTSIAGLVEAGIIIAKGGKVRLLPPKDLADDWNPDCDPRLTVWEMTHHLIRKLDFGGDSAAAGLVQALGAKAETARELAYRLYTLCERTKRANEALAYNGLVQSWPQLIEMARDSDANPASTQGDFFGAK